MLLPSLVCIAHVAHAALKRSDRWTIGSVANREPVAQLSSASYGCTGLQLLVRASRRLCASFQVSVSKVSFCISQKLDGLCVLRNAAANRTWLVISFTALTCCGLFLYFAIAVMQQLLTYLL
jgi:hypothetical protein